MSDGYYEDQYDPDMPVSEALRLGLIAIIDTGMIGNGAEYMESCGHQSDWTYSHPSDAYTVHGSCNRSVGHTGQHAFVARWSPRSNEAHIEDLKDRMETVERFQQGAAMTAAIRALQKMQKEMAMVVSQMEQTRARRAEMEAVAKAGKTLGVGGTFVGLDEFRQWAIHPANPDTFLQQRKPDPKQAAKTENQIREAMRAEQTAIWNKANPQRGGKIKNPKGRK